MNSNLFAHRSTETVDLSVSGIPHFPLYGLNIDRLSAFTSSNHMECEHSMKIITVRSKRRRRRRRHESDKEIPESPPIAAHSPSIDIEEKIRLRLGHTKSCSCIEKSILKLTTAQLRHLHRKSLQLSIFLKVMLFLLLFFANSSALSASSLSPCDKDSWWDSFKDRCILCTVCQGDMIPLRPCQLHRDTICGSIYDLKIDWVVLAKTEPNWKERRKMDGAAYGLSALEQQQLSNEELQQLHDDAIAMDWQTATLFMAVLACLLFFIVAACILIHHMRQWRRMERRLDQDVEELSTKLMAKLAEVQTLEGGTFFIGNADALQVPVTAFQTQHVLLPAEKPSKHHQHHIRQHEHRFLKTTQTGNVYIENGSKA